MLQDSHLMFREEQRLSKQEELLQLDAQILESVKITSELRSRRNTFAPVSCLPGEILAHIFSCLTKEELKGWFWIYVTHTCKHWREIAINSPGLWSYISSFKNADMVKGFLQRSKQAELTIYFKGVRGRGEEAAIENYCLVLEHWSRICDLEVKGVRWSMLQWQNMCNTFVGETSRLRRLCLSCEIYHVAGDLDFAFDCTNIIRSTPLLRSLILYGYFFNPCHAPKNLSQLVLVSSQHDFLEEKPTIAELIKVLELSPNLETFVLDSMGPMDSPFDPATRIKLPKLRKLKLAYLNMKVGMSLLHILEPAEDVEWDIGFLDYPILDPYIDFPMYMIPKAKCKTLQVSFGVENITFGSDISLESQQSKASFITTKLTLNRNNTPNVNEENDISFLFNALSKIVTSCFKFWEDVPTLEVYIFQTDVNVLAEHWVTLLQVFECTQTLQCYFSRNFRSARVEEALVGALMDPKFQTLLCPDLRDIHFLCANFSPKRGAFKERLIQCIKYRKYHNAPIGFLVISDGIGIEQRDIDILRAHLDEVHWDERVFSEDEHNFTSL